MGVAFPDQYDEQPYYALSGDELVLLDESRSMRTKDMMAAVAIQADEREDYSVGGDWEIGWWDNEGAPGIFKRRKEPRPPLDVPWNVSSPPAADDEFTNTAVSGPWDTIGSGDYSVGEGRGVAQIYARDGGQGGIFQDITELDDVGGSFSVATKVQLDGLPVPNCGTGLALIESDETGKALTFGVGYGDEPFLAITKFTSFGVLDDTAYEIAPFHGAAQPVWLRIDYTGSAWRFWYSLAGQMWLQLPEIADMDLGFTATKVGLATISDQADDNSNYAAGFFSWFRDLSVAVFD